MTRVRCPLLAQSGHTELHCTCPLSGAKQTCRFALQMPGHRHIDFMEFCARRIPRSFFLRAGRCGVNGGCRFWRIAMRLADVRIRCKSGHRNWTAQCQLMIKADINSAMKCAAATGGRWIYNARSRRAVCPIPCARPGARSGRTSLASRAQCRGRGDSREL